MALARIDILLATYNGARHLPEQLASLAAQTAGELHLVLRDDGSQDGSAELVQDWAAGAGMSFECVSDAEPRIGPTRSFARLLEVSRAPYFMFCDQDDVWLPDKTGRLLARVRAAEAENGPDMPVLAHGDLAVVDSRLREIHASFWQQQGTAETALRQAFSARLAFHNVATGCACLGNAALRRRALPMPEAAILHDWWCALVAAGTGRLVAEPAPTVLYRQHGQNAAGARRRDLAVTLWRGLRAPQAAVRRTREMIRRTRAQSAALLATQEEVLPETVRAELAAWAELGRRGWWTRRGFLWREAFRPHRLPDDVLLSLLL